MAQQLIAMGATFCSCLLYNEFFTAVLTGFFYFDFTTHFVALCCQLLQGVAMCSIISPLTELLLPGNITNKSGQQLDNKYKYISSV